MALLWDGLPSPRRGPRQRLDLARIVRSSVVEAEQAPERTGSADDEWWQQRAPLLDERIDGRLPRLEMLEQAEAFGVSDRTLPYTLQRALNGFAVGLDLVFDSIDAHVAAPRP